MIRTTRSLPAAGMLLLLAACQGPTATSTTANPAEARFVTDAFEIIEFDRQEGKQGQTEARDPRVKALAGSVANGGWTAIWVEAGDGFWLWARWRCDRTACSKGGISRPR